MENILADLPEEMVFVERENVKSGPRFEIGELAPNHVFVGWIPQDEGDITISESAVFRNSCKF